MVPRTRLGEFRPGFSDVTWGNGYTEGNAWHHSFPPYAIETIEKLYSSRGGVISVQEKGKDLLLKKLIELFRHPGVYNVGSYGQEIHEMREMKVSRSRKLSDQSNNIAWTIDLGNGTIRPQQSTVSSYSFYIRFTR